jgi:hypothetical protein
MARRDPQPLQNRESLVLSIEQTGQRTIVRSVLTREARHWPTPALRVEAELEQEAELVGEGHGLEHLAHDLAGAGLGSIATTWR